VSRALATALTALCLVGVLAACGEDEPDVTGEADFAATTPDGWDVGDKDALQAGGTAAISEFEESADLPEDVELQTEWLALWFDSDPGEFRTNINVFREPVKAGREEGYLRFSLQGIERSRGVKAELTEGPQVGGTPSDAFDYTLNAEGLELQVRTLTVFRDGNAYNITLTAPAAEFSEAEAALDEIVSSWTWED
jgi:hypothetical protein